MPGKRLSLWRRERSSNPHGFDSRPHSPPSMERSSRRTRISGACSTIRVRCCAGPTQSASPKRVWCGDCLTARVHRCSARDRITRLSASTTTSPNHSVLSLHGTHRTVPVTGHPRAHDPSNGASMGSPPCSGPFEGSLRGPPPVRGTLRGVSPTGAPRAQDPSKGLPKGVTPHKSPFEGSRDDFVAGVRNHGGSPWIATPANAR